MSTALQKHEPAAMQRNPLDMMAAILERPQITGEGVAALTEMVKLQQLMEDRQATKDFAAAFVALQADIPVITAMTAIPNRGKYEKFEDLMKTLKPLLTRHGFSVAFSMDAKDGRVSETCHLTHISGHVVTNSFTVRTGRADSETQADCKAATTAKRLALCNALNIIIQQDVDFDESDARLDGDGSTLSLDQQEHIRQRVEEVRAILPQFLKVFNVGTIGAIPAKDYERALALLDMKEKQNAKEARK